MTSPDLGGPARGNRATGGRPALLVGVLALAAAGAMIGLGRQPLWFDELATVSASGLSWSGLHALLTRTDANIGLYYVALHTWRLLGDSPLLLRLPSALATIGTVLLTQRVGRRLIGPGPALLAAGLLALHPFATAYARDARPYALVALCCTAALLLGLRASEYPTTGWLTGYGVVATLAVYLHLYAVLAVAAYGWALLPGRADGRRRWLLTHVLIAAASLPVLVISLRQHAQLAWVPALSPLRVLSGLALLAGGALPLALLVLAALLAWLGRVGESRTRRVLLAGLAVPVLTLLAASAVAPTFVPRYLIATAPLQCLLLAGVLTVLRGRAVQATVLVVLVGWFGVATVSQVAAPFRYEDYRAASRSLLGQARPGDAVLYQEQGARLGLRYYLPRVARRGQPLPTDVLAVAGAPARPFAVSELTGAAAARALQAYRRIWLVSHLDVASSAASVLSRYSCRPQHDFGLVAVRLCSRAVVP